MDDLLALKKLPPWAWGLAIAGGVGLWLWSRRTTSSSTPVTAASPTLVGQGSINASTPSCQDYPLPTCATGQQVVWQLDGQGCPMPVCSGSSGAGSGTQTGIVRSSTTSGCSANYDSTSTGVPVRPGASANGMLGEARYGSSVTVTGPAVNGGSNFGSNPAPGCVGSLLWYPVSWFGLNGYISAYDFVSVG